MKKNQTVSLTSLLALFYLASCVNSAQVDNLVEDAQSCPEVPDQFVKNSEDISIENDAIEVSDTVSFGKYKGYTFEGTSGDKLSYQTDAPVCIWIYDPRSTLMTNNELMQNGKYLVQVSALKGTTTFDLTLSLGNDSTKIANSKPNESEQKNQEQQNFEQIDIDLPRSQQSSVQGNSSSPQQQTSSSNNSFSQEKAVQLIVSWLKAKSKIFADPFDRGLVGKLTTGILYEDITKPGGSIDWLQNNSSYYVYHETSIKNSSDFSNNGSTASVKVSIYENRTLYGRSGRPDPNESRASTKSYTYYFTNNNGTWKISDYK